MFEEAGFTPRVKLALSQLVTAYRFAGSGVGAAFVSDRIIQKAPSQNLMFYSIDSPEVDRLFYTLMPQRNYTAHAVKAFITYALEQIGTRDNLAGRNETQINSCFGSPCGTNPAGTENR